MATNGIIQIPPDDTTPGFKRVETWELTVASLLVHREVDRLGGTNPLEIAEVRGTDPTVLDHGLVVRQAPPDAIRIDPASSIDLAQGASVDLDATTIASGFTGKLLKVEVASTVACQWEIKTRDGAVLVTKHTFFTGGLASSPSWTYRPSSKEGITLLGAGIDENFRVTATNLEGSPKAGDVHATIEWDQVA